VDRINDDGTNVNLTIVKTHFVDLVKNEPVTYVQLKQIVVTSKSMLNQVFFVFTIIGGSCLYQRVRPNS